MHVKLVLFFRWKNSTHNHDTTQLATISSKKLVSLEISQMVFVALGKSTRGSTHSKSTYPAAGRWCISDLKTRNIVQLHTVEVKSLGKRHKKIIHIGNVLQRVGWHYSPCHYDTTRSVALKNSPNNSYQHIYLVIHLIENIAYKQKIFMTLGFFSRISMSSLVSINKITKKYLINIFINKILDNRNVAMLSEYGI